MLTKAGVAFTALIMGALLLATVCASIQMMFFGNWIVLTMGIALLILSMIAMWALIVELKFGFASNRILNHYLDEGHEPIVWGLATTTSGRTEKSAAIVERDIMREKLSKHPEDWRVHLELGFLEAAAGDKPAGRRATREAIRLEREATHT